LLGDIRQLILITASGLSNLLELQIQLSQVQPRIGTAQINIPNIRFRVYKICCDDVRIWLTHDWKFSNRLLILIVLYLSYCLKVRRKVC